MKKWQPTPIFLPGKSHGQRSLAGYSPWGRKQSDTTKHTHFTPFVNMEKGFQEGERSIRAKKKSGPRRCNQQKAPLVTAAPEVSVSFSPKN